jgi:hypothetical protein
MALVRRIMLLGQSPAVKAVESVVAQAARTYQGVAAAPHQPGVAHAPDAAQAAPPPPPPVQAAASAPNLAASTPAVLTAFILVAVGMIIAYEMPKRNPFQVSSAMAAYGGLPVFHRYYAEAEQKPNFYLDPIARDLGRFGEIRTGVAEPVQAGCPVAHGGAPAPAAAIESPTVAMRTVGATRLKIRPAAPVGYAGGEWPS